MTAWSLEAARERAASTVYVAPWNRIDQEDRVQLLALVDRMRAYMQHKPDCDSYPDIYTLQHGGSCDCGLDAILIEIDGGGTR